MAHHTRWKRAKCLRDKGAAFEASVAAASLALRQGHDVRVSVTGGDSAIGALVEVVTGACLGRKNSQAIVSAGEVCGRRSIRSTHALTQSCRGSTSRPPALNRCARSISRLAFL